MFKMRIINRQICVHLNQLPSSVFSTLVRESVRVGVNYLIRQKHSKLALQEIKEHRSYRHFIYAFLIYIYHALIYRLCLIGKTFRKTVS